MSAQQPVSCLKELLVASRLRGCVNPEDFERIVLAGDGPPTPTVLIPPEDFLAAAVQVLDRALAVNPDESTVLRWYRHERLADFGMKTPMEITALGRADALLAYVDSVEAGSSG